MLHIDRKLQSFSVLHIFWGKQCWISLWKFISKRAFFDRIVLQSPQPNGLRPKNISLVHLSVNQPAGNWSPSSSRKFYLCWSSSTQCCYQANSFACRMLLYFMICFCSRIEAYNCHHESLCSYGSCSLSPLGHCG